MTISSDMFQTLTGWDNLWLAYRKAARGKRGKAPAAHFEFNTADHLARLQAELRSRCYQPGGYDSFVIHEGKRRLISAAPFRDRVVHHALCNLIEPIFDARFHPHSYANRVGKGTHAAVDQLQRYARQHPYVLRMDIRQHFPAIDHAILRRELAAVIHDPAVMWLVDRILESGIGVLADEYDLVYFPGDDLFAANRPRGLPIGNLTSQFWSNVMLNPFDWFVARELGCKAYLRYVDDFALFAGSKAQLYRWKKAITRRLARLRLTAHEAQAQVIPVAHGIPWLGFVVYPHHRRVKARNVIHFRQRFAQKTGDYLAGRITFAELDASVQGWINHVRYADTWSLRQQMFDRPIPPPHDS